MLPPTPLKLQNAPPTLPNVSGFDRDTDLRTLPPTPQIIGSAYHAGGGVGVGLGLERTWNFERALGQRAYGSFSNTSWSSGSSEVGTPISATFPPDVRVVGASAATSGEEQCHGLTRREGDEYVQGQGYQHDIAQSYTPMGLTAAQDAQDADGQMRQQKRFKVE